MTTYCWQNEPAAPSHPHEDFVAAVSLGIIVGGGITGGLYLACRVFQGWVGRTIGTVVFGALGLVLMTAVVFVGCMVTNNVYMR